MSLATSLAEQAGSHVGTHLARPPNFAILLRQMPGVIPNCLERLTDLGAGLVVRLHIRQVSLSDF